MVDEAFYQLPEDSRHILRALDVDRRDVNEVAGELGQTRKDTLAMLYRSRARFATLLDLAMTRDRSPKESR